MRLLKYKEFESSIATYDYKLVDLVRCKDLTDEEFLEILKKNCKNFSFENDLLWRSKDRKGKSEYQLFESNLRRAKPIAFPNFFDKIKDDPDYPVKRQKSLIGGTDNVIVKKLIGGDVWLVIPFDGAKIVFCPIVDLWGLDDERRKSSEKIGGKDVGPENFIMKEYVSNFKVPFQELEKLPKANLKADVEFFTSDSCLLLHESKVNWLRDIIQ